jgi:hypothetical protein
MFRFGWCSQFARPFALLPPSRKQSGALEIREGQALFGQMGAQYADRDQTVARPQDSHGTKLEGCLDGKLYLEDTQAQPVSGRIGLWSKAGSYMRFTDYTVTMVD